MTLFFDLTATHLARAYALAGRTTDALALLGQIEGRLVVRGEAYLFAGKMKEADRLVQRGLAQAREHKLRGEEARALWLLGEIAMRRDPPDIVQTTTHYQQALSLAEELSACARSRRIATWVSATSTPLPLSDSRAGRSCPPRSRCIALWT